VDLPGLDDPILETVEASIDPASDPLDGVITYTVISNCKQAVLLEKPQRRLKSILVSEL
jgi:hypothetical protein